MTLKCPKCGYIFPASNRYEEMKEHVRKLETISYESLAEAANIHISQAGRWLRRMEAEGFVTLEKRGMGGKRIYKLT